MNGSEPATKQDIADLRTDLKADFDAKIDQLRTEMNHSYRDVVERLDDGLTKLLTAFYNVAESHGKRLMDLENTGASTITRLATVENRLLEIERRLNFPPAA